ncbi:complex I intermediate-associated protein 30-domain-containing protein [Aspergillus spinulosporus]
MVESPKYLFGGPHPWLSADWKSTDDRVRGGSSCSHLFPSHDGKIATFNGHLDTRTLGGAGFASQRTTGDQSWDISSYSGLEVDINTAKSDTKLYTLIVKDEKGLLPPRDDGRERSGLSWEADFRPSYNRGKVAVKWEDFRPTYRGKEVRDVEPLDCKAIKRFSIMMRSFFGEQEGNFGLSIASIAAWKDSWEDTLGLEKDGGVAVETKEAPDDGSWSVDGDDSSPACCVIL